MEIPSDSCPCKSVSLLSLTSDFISVYLSHLSLFSLSSPTSLRCTLCSRIHELGILAPNIMDEFKRYKEAEQKAQELRDRETANPPGCGKCKNDELALYRPDLGPHGFAEVVATGAQTQPTVLGMRSDAGEEAYRCTGCGLRLQGRKQAGTDWVHYFRKKDGDDEWDL